MTPQHVISQLLESDSKHLKNIDLLRKIILTTYFGRLQINGLSPDHEVALGNYLFDNERTMFDFTRLSDAKKNLFMRWLLGAHQNEKEKSYFSGVAVNEYRGFTAEVKISWWRRLKNWLYNSYAEHWKINDLDLSLNYQLLGVEMSHGEQGILVGFNQFLTPPTGTKYKASNDPQDEPLGNTKRVFITDQLVDKLTKINVHSLNYRPLCKGAHPMAIHVTNPADRYQEMHNFRKIQKYFALKPWYERIWNWCLSWFHSEEPLIKKTKPKVNNKLVLLYENETTSVYQRTESSEILVKEKRPNIENLVLCGGGAKIFAHIGVWKALNEYQIRPQKFAGSSAGAIMALLCYLGLSAEKIAALLKHFKQEHLVHLDIDSNGLSDAHALKTALDYAIALKLKEIVAQYKIPYPKGKITFATLEALRVQCPDCGLGNELIVTATNIPLRKTSYFSFAKTPAMEVSEAVKVSASFPIIYRNTLINGEEHNDGGILNNFPTDAFRADDSTFLESEYGNNMKTLAVQFDNGTERATVDRMMEQVYRENFFMNWIYGLLTGVSDPASAWEQDRMKLRKYAAQSIIVDVGTTSSTGFSVEEEQQVLLINNGYKTAKSYLSARYAKKAQSPYRNKEIMHDTFASLGELLAYCCYKGDKRWFDVVSNLIEQSTALPNKLALMKQAQELRTLYFSQTNSIDGQKLESNNSSAFFGHGVVQQLDDTDNSKNHEILLILFPIFLKLSHKLLTTPKDKKLLDRARSTFSSETLFSSLKNFTFISEDMHIVLHIFINLLKELKNNPTESTFEGLKLVHDVLYNHPDLFKPEYYCQWDLNNRQGLRVLKLLNTNDSYSKTLCDSLRRKAEPLQTFNGTSYQDIDKVELEQMSFKV